MGERIRRLVPADVVVEEPERRGNQVEKMLAGFQLNLTALSMVSLLVGAFLIYNTVAASVVRRRSEIGILSSARCQPGKGWVALSRGGNALRSNWERHGLRRRSALGKLACEYGFKSCY